MSTKVMSNVIDAILTFWFGESDSEAYGQNRAAWFTKDPAFDAKIRTRFARVIDAAALGQLDMMAESPEGAVALVVVLDQFPRNVYRDVARAFENDAHALHIAKQAIEKGFDREVIPVMRKFLYLPFEHSENLADQERALELFSALGGEDLEWAQKHHVIIARFGRFPHRNGVLGRLSTPEEKAFLSEPGSSF
ncbi:DUF924 family protein [Magnetovibrio sp.]|uniref:DUF924 family protein n=1 Tax=Magnetovibrio sp. TaxID=2024836 RepID=UPI002F9292C7